MRKVHRWQIQQQPQDEEVDADPAAAALDVLIGPVAGEVPEHPGTVLDGIAEGYQEAVLQVPEE
jgi:hypothetical protein